MKMKAIEITLGSVTSLGAIVAASDPTLQNIITTAIGALVTITTVYFGFRTAQLKAKMEAADKKLAENEHKLATHDVKIEEVVKASDGMKDALVKATADASLAKGVLSGIEQAEAKAATKAQGVAEGIAQAKPPP